MIRIGDLPTSKTLRGWLAGLQGARQIVVDPHGGWQDPDSVLELVLRADPAALQPPPAAAADWLQSWRAGDARAAAAVTQTLGEELSEPNVARALEQALPADATVFVAASMPVRDIEWFWPAREDSAPGTLKPRRQRHRRHALERAGGRRGRDRPGRRADRRRRFRPRPLSPARRQAAWRRADGRARSTTAAPRSSTIWRSHANAMSTSTTSRRRQK